MTKRTRASQNRTKSSGAAITSAATVKTRRAHTKSRNGCIECKHRHIRCDERQPICSNCEAAERICSFVTPQAGKQKQKQGLQHRTKRQQQLEVSPGSEVSRHSNDKTISNADEDSTELLAPVLRQRKIQPDLSQAPDQLSQRSSPTPNFLPFITGLGANHQQIPSSALPLQPNDIHSPPTDCCPGLSAVPDAATKAIFTPQHMILLHHAYAVPNFTGHNRNAVDVAIRNIIESPYLIDEVLAFTAFHMASLYPGSAVVLQRLSTELQTRALTSFTRLTEMVPGEDKSTAVPRFLFSGILGRHVLAETLTHCHSEFHYFIDRFVECFNLNRGVRATILPAFDYLHNSELQPFLSVFREAEAKIISPGNECDPLNRLMDDSDLNETSIEACRQAIKWLQWCFDVCRGLDEDEYPQSASAFVVKVEVGFINLLHKHRPEALVVLAYYGVLLHRCRSFWAFGDAGASMVRAIAGQLGNYWQEALAWPLYVLETEHIPKPQILAP